MYPFSEWTSSPTYFMSLPAMILGGVCWHPMSCCTRGLEGTQEDASLGSRRHNTAYRLVIDFSSWAANTPIGFLGDCPGPLSHYRQGSSQAQGHGSAAAEEALIWPILRSTDRYMDAE